MKLIQTIANLRICSDALAEVDSWDMFFPVVLATRQVVEDILPKPYVGTPAPLPPAEIFALVDNLNKLENAEVCISEFLCNTLDPFVEKLDKAIYAALSVAVFETSLAALLRSLALREDVKDEVAEIQIHAQQDVENAITALWTAFSALPEDEKMHRLPPLTKAEEQTSA